MKRTQLAKEFWLKDEACHTCFACGGTFTTFRRKHHCRMCGRIFDSQCTSIVSDSKFRGYGAIRVCHECKDIMEEEEEVSEDEEYTSSIMGPVSSQVAFAMPTDHRPKLLPLMSLPAVSLSKDGRHSHTQVEFHDINENSSPRRSLLSKGVNANSNLARPSAISTNNSAAYVRGRSNSYLADENAVLSAPFQHRMLFDEDELEPIGTGACEVYVTDLSATSPERTSATIDDMMAPLYNKVQRRSSHAPEYVERHSDLVRQRSDPKQHNRSKRFSKEENSTYGGGIPVQRTNSNSHRRTRSRTRPLHSPQPPSDRKLSEQSIKPSQSIKLNDLTVEQNSSTAFDVSKASIQHMADILKQLLTRAELDDIEGWTKVLMPILLKISKDLDPDVRIGGDIDVRRYVKIKRIPDGRKEDTMYVEGYVFTKNLALKQMPRHVGKPKIMALDFTIEHHHAESHLLSLEPVITQGEEYIKNVVRRILAFQPTVLLVRGQVSGSALAQFSENKVATLHNLKESSLEGVAHCTGADIVTSSNRLALQPNLGVCELFTLRTIIYGTTERRRKKTLAFFEGCSATAGCTVVLRGAKGSILSIVKKILKFTTFVIHNLKLETSLFRDEFAMTLSTPLMSPSFSLKQYPFGNYNEDGECTHEYAQLINKYHKTILSASPSTSFPVPYLLEKCAIFYDLVKKLCQGQLDLDSITAQKNVTTDDDKIDSLVQNIETTKADKICQMKSSNTIEQRNDNVMAEEKSTEQPMKEDRNFATQNSTVDSMLLNRKQIICAYELQRARLSLAFFQKQWSMQNVPNDTALSPYSHQSIIVLYSNVCALTTIPCTGPGVDIFTFYSDFDCTLGQYIEDLVTSSLDFCEVCGMLQMQHYKSYVHRNSRLSVAIEEFPCPLPGMENSLLMWSFCKVCKTTTPIASMSDLTWKYSFGKYLELSFYGEELRCRANSCSHNLHTQYVRYFGLRNCAVRFQYDPIEILGVMVPEFLITRDPQAVFKLRDAEVNFLEDKINQYFDSVETRIQSINLDNFPPDLRSSCFESIALLTRKSVADRSSTLSHLQLISYTGNQLASLPLNATLKRLNELVIQWDQKFSDFAKLYIIKEKEKESRNNIAAQLKAVFSDRDTLISDTLEGRRNIAEMEKEILEVTEATVNPPGLNYDLTRRGSLNDVEVSLKGLNSISFDFISKANNADVSIWKALNYPIDPTEHLFFDSDVIVREDEPSSIIAFTLSSIDYQEKLAAMRDLSVFNPMEASQVDTTANSLEPSLLKNSGTHIKYQLQDGAAAFYCKIFYAEQFDAFRRVCACDAIYIESLARCVKWDSSGGRSGSSFLKTQDDRFIIKNMSKYEMDAFINFAPAYFEYMAQAFFHDLPTVLGKVLGFYQIGSKNTVTGKNMKMDVLVMENLLYNRKTSRIFDLKGSMRNRHVQSTGKANEVLLDENLVEYIYESPLFVREHSKRMLRASLWNDTLFLAKMNVMDYSLVIGIDDEKNELVVGIIDFIRTFTWDKKLESWVKERGLVGGGQKEPTVVTPRQYKNRFRESMDRYFLMVPSCWHQLNLEALRTSSETSEKNISLS